MAASPYSAVRQRREQRRMRLVGLGYADYADYLRSAHWRQTKARYRASGQPQDCMCGVTYGLQLHHMTYERVGAEELSDLTPLCPTCHAMVHVLEARGDIGLDFSGLVSDRRAARYADERVPALERAKAENAPPALWERLRRIERYAEPMQLESIERRIAKLEKTLFQ